MNYILANSPRFGHSVNSMPDPRLDKKNLEKIYWKRHCENIVTNPKLLMEWFLYEIVDYDKVVELYL